ncbi:MAG: hypothetical protein ABI548_27100 [Polyangiaceae bacterium]
MSGDVQLREIDRGARGKLVCTVHREPKPFIRFQHINPDGTLGGRLVALLDEVPRLLDVLRSGQDILSPSRHPQHRTVRASDEIARQLEEDRRLF